MISDHALTARNGTHVPLDQDRVPDCSERLSRARPHITCLTMDERRGLDDAQDARFAWARYRRILGWMNLVALVAGGAVVAFLWLRDPALPWLFALFVFAGIYATILLTAALMGLMFLSNGTGHDEQVMDLHDPGHPIDD